MTSLSTLLVMLALLLACSPAQAQSTFHGIGRALDGDSLMVGEREVRLVGIDAPERGQTCERGGEQWRCGEEAADQLSKLATGKSVRCENTGTDQYNRVLGRCTVGTTDMNRTMVALGFAVAYREYSSDYVSAEESARAVKRGLWSGEFQKPSDYRRGVHAPVQSRPASERSSSGVSSSDWAGRAKADCNIKGNRNRRGQWIYQLPGMPY